MADNRIFLRCKGCGAVFFLGKRIGGGYHVDQYPNYNGVPMMDRLNDFYDAHESCRDQGPDCFEMVYENKPNPTNYERLLAMSITALSKEMRGCPDSVQVCPKIPCDRCWLLWLQKEAEPCN